MMKQFLLIFPSTQELVLEAITVNWLIILFIMIYTSIFWCISNQHQVKQLHVGSKGSTYIIASYEKANTEWPSSVSLCLNL